MASPKSKKKVKKKIDAYALIVIKATFNNTLITITSSDGDVIAWASAGKAGFKGSRKSMPYAATVASEQVAKQALELGVRRVDIRVKGGGAGREAAIRAIRAAGLEINSIKDITGVPHNGCRPRKRRRV
jgi:small subunit ribosomal protein S11